MSPVVLHEKIKSDLISYHFSYSNLDLFKKMQMSIFLLITTICS